MPMYCHFLSTSEYQYKKIGSNMLHFQLCLKTFRQGGLIEKVTQVLLRRKVMLCYDTNRFSNSCMFFKILR